MVLSVGTWSNISPYIIVNVLACSMDMKMNVITVVSPVIRSWSDSQGGPTCGEIPVCSLPGEFSSVMVVYNYKFSWDDLKYRTRAARPSFKSSDSLLGSA